MPYQNIIKILEDLKIPYKEIEHEATTSCEHSAEIRSKQGLEGIGSKCVVMKASKSERIFLCVTIGTVDIHKRMLKPVMGEKEFRFVDKEMLFEYLGVEPGCVYPFGHHLDMLTLVDEEIFSHKYFIFNPATPTKSLQIKTSDLKNIYNTLYTNVMYFSSHTQSTNE